MSGFTSELTITQLSGRPDAWMLWRLEEPLIYEIGDTGRIIMVSKGFITDGPSVPRALWQMLPVWASWSRAGVIHDYLCCLIAIGRPHREAPTRNDADRIFHEAMVSLGVGSIQKNLMYAGVRFGTWFGVRTSMIDHNEKLRSTIEAAADGI